MPTGTVEQGGRPRVYLYELALKMDERSADLAVRARELGLAGAGPNTMLTGPQAAALRGGAPMPPGSGFAGTTLTAADPDAARPAPAGPLAWSREPEDAAATPAVPAVATAGGSHVGDPSLWTLPPPPGARGEGPSGTTPAPGKAALSRSKWGLHLGVAIVVVSAVGLLVWNSSHGDGREAALLAHNARIDAQTKADASEDAAKLNAGSVPSAVPSGEPAAVSKEIVDRPSFCAAARTVQIVEFRAAANRSSTDWASSQRAILAGQDTWLTSVNTLFDTTSGQLRSNISSYRIIYVSFLDSVAASTSPAGLQAAYAAIPTAKLGTAAVQVSQAVQTCR